MREAIAFPDATQVVATYLNDTLGVTTGTRVPNPRPAEFFVVRRVGGVRRELVMDDATLTVEAWSVTPQEALDLAELARAHLSALQGDFVGSALVYRVLEIAGPADLPDPLTSTPRVTFTIQATIRGSALETAS